MKFLKFLTVFCVLFIGSNLVGTAFCSANEVNFPRVIVYKVFDDKDHYVGECTLKFSKRGSKRTEYKTYTLTLSDFKGFGFSSDEILITDMYKTDLSIYSIILVKKGTRVPTFEARAIEGGDGIISNTKKTYRFKAQNKSGTLDTGLYSKHKVIDLLSSFVMAAQMVRNQQAEADFYFLIKEISRVVKMKTLPEMQLRTEGRSVKTIPVSLLHQPKGGEPQEIFKFYIDSKDYYPIQVTIPHGDGVITLRKHKRM